MERVAFLLALFTFSGGASAETIDKSLEVTTIVSKPFTMLKQNARELRGNDRFEGFNVDLMHRISKIVGFNYSMRIVGDGAYGRLLDDNTWSGMVGELLERKADVALADMTITAKRENVVDFTTPFMNVGITVLYKKPAMSGRDLFTFMKPFSPPVWVAICLAYLGMGLLHYGSARMSVSTGPVVGLWWFFTIITVSMYTASMTGFISYSTHPPTVKSLEELMSGQNAVMFGCVEGGATASFFKNSKVSTYATLWTKMNRDQGYFFQSADSCVEAVGWGDGAFACLLESTLVEYVVERSCDLMQVGGLLNSRGYGIALPSNSPYTTGFNEAILQLHESGEIEMLKEKWWKTERGGERCQGQEGGSAMLGMDAIGGVFIVLALGLGIVCCLALVERFLCKKIKGSKQIVHGQGNKQQCGC